MTELTILRTVRPGVWIAEANGQHFVVRKEQENRLPLYRAAAEALLPLPRIVYVGPDVEGRSVIVEEILGLDGGTEDAAAWRTLASLSPILACDETRLALAFARTVEGLAWLHTGGFIHGNLSPSTILLHPRGSVRFASLDCLQAAPGPAACIAYSRKRRCQEQVEGWVSTATDVRLLALTFADILAARPGRVWDENETVRLSGAGVLDDVLEAMAAVPPDARRPLRATIASFHTPTSTRPSREPPETPANDGS